MSTYNMFTYENSLNPKPKEESCPLSEDEEKEACKAFTLLDEDGDGLIDIPVLENLLIKWGRLPLDDELIEMLSYIQEEETEERRGMSYEGFLQYLRKQLDETTDEEELRQAFQVFDSSPPTGKVNLTELRHYLKKTGLKLTDDEIDFLFREEDYWMLEEKNIFEYEELIKKILNKPTCNSRFLNC